MILKMSLILAFSFTLTTTVNADPYSTKCLLLLSQLEKQEFKTCIFSSAGNRKSIISAKISSLDLNYMVNMIDETGAIQTMDLFKVTEDANGDNKYVNGLSTEFVVCMENNLMFQITTPEFVKWAAGKIKRDSNNKSFEAELTDKSFHQTSLTCSQ